MILLSYQIINTQFGSGSATQFQINNIVMDFSIDVSDAILNFNKGAVNLYREFQKVRLNKSNRYFCRE